MIGNPLTDHANDDEVDFASNKDSPPRHPFLRRVDFEWAFMEDAICRSSASVVQYLHIGTGAVVCLEHGVTEPELLESFRRNREQRFIHPVPSAQQYEWLEDFIDTVEDDSVADRLAECIHGKGAFRRFKDVLAEDRALLHAWYAFRIQRIHGAVQRWLTSNGLVAASPPPPPVWGPLAPPRPRQSARIARRYLQEVASSLQVADLIALTDLALFLSARAAR